jgi:hypothetical protein
MVLLEAAGACAAVALLLLLHHGWTHFFEDETSAAKRESCAWVCYFQLSDVGNFRMWNHETFIVLLTALEAGLVFVAFVSGTP